MMRGRSLALRLAIPLAAVVVIVLLLAGLLVNRAASRSLDETLGPRDQQRLNLAAAIVEESLDRGVDRRGLQLVLQRLAAETRGAVRVIDGEGSVLAEASRLPRGSDSETLSVDLSNALDGVALEIEVPSAATPFVRAFNTALLLTGIGAVVALLVSAAFLANRLTAPLRQVAVAARRLGAGDLGARATPGPDAESAELAEAFNGMADRLERSELLRRRAASDLAHDLATPATVLESQLQAMVDGVVPADATELERARAAATSLSSVIGQLGELTQAESAPLHRQVEALALDELGAEVLGALDGLLRERGVTGVTEGTPASVEADRAQLGRALRNLVTNAIQHAPTGSAVRIRTGRDGPSATLRVTDAGHGIAPEDLPYVFERFYRADRSRGTAPGSGIGLTVARELVAANGGALTVESTGPEGTTFLVTLPAS